ncbi:hypothetical protein O1L55_20655 [Streptomyces albulus]|nr:hypothetical protein [Streptomyces noursei]
MDHKFLYDMHEQSKREGCTMHVAVSHNGATLEGVVNGMGSKLGVVANGAFVEDIRPEWVVAAKLV